jgi:hypothetical protein
MPKPHGSHNKTIAIVKALRKTYYPFEDGEA